TIAAFEHVNIIRDKRNFDIVRVEASTRQCDMFGWCYLACRDTDGSYFFSSILVSPFYRNSSETIPVDFRARDLEVRVGKHDGKGDFSSYTFFAFYKGPAKEGENYLIKGNKPVKVDEIGKKNILNAMQTFDNLTNGCVKFIERTTEADYIYIVAMKECFSYIGRIGGAQKVDLATGCKEFMRYIFHELFHVLGFEHEHIRPDRDEYISVEYENIIDDEDIQILLKRSKAVEDIKYFDPK
ncbi:Astacin-like metalloendopeptidase, partial [Armadillidium nasatum]